MPARTLKSEAAVNMSALLPRPHSTRLPRQYLFSLAKAKETTGNFLIA